MKNAKREMKRKGFTLVELLIVIVVIGVLSAMMMLSSTEAVSSAKAADIVSDLRNLKTAALAWYADNLASADNLGSTSDASNGLNKYRTQILKYMNNGTADPKYTFGGTKDPETWYVWYNNTNNGGNDSKTGEKLISRQGSVGLKKGTSAYATSGTTLADSDKTTFVGMFIR